MILVVFITTQHKKSSSTHLSSHHQWTSSSSTMLSLVLLYIQPILQNLTYSVLMANNVTFYRWFLKWLNKYVMSFANTHQPTWYIFTKLPVWFLWELWVFAHSDTRRSNLHQFILLNILNAVIQTVVQWGIKNHWNKKKNRKKKKKKKEILDY